MVFVTPRKTFFFLNCVHVFFIGSAVTKVELLSLRMGFEETSESKETDVGN